jgi:mitochondrial import receptor subunit TOM40
MGRFNYQWSPKDLTKVQVQVSTLHLSSLSKVVSLNVRHRSHLIFQFAASPSAPSLAQFEHDRIGRDYSLNLKTYNPSPADLSGAYMASYLQSLTKNVALGAEVIYQRAPTGMEESAMSYVGKYTSNKRDWIATAQVQAQGILQTTYWQKLSDKVDVAAELVLVPDVRPTERKAMATVGVKYDFRTAVFRAQVESTGKISALLEQRISPILGFLFSGEIDHWKVRRPHSDSRTLAFTSLGDVE